MQCGSGWKRSRGVLHKILFRFILPIFMDDLDGCRLRGIPLANILLIYVLSLFPALLWFLLISETSCKCCLFETQ